MHFKPDKQTLVGSEIVRLSSKYLLPIHANWIYDSFFNAETWDTTLDKLGELRLSKQSSKHFFRPHLPSVACEMTKVGRHTEYRAVYDKVHTIPILDGPNSFDLEYLLQSERDAFWREVGNRLQRLGQESTRSRKRREIGKRLYGSSQESTRFRERLELEKDYLW
ncbi:hypothetical protein GQ43DRAFT_439601 [Delitschia confertaspora ATCC 74209]|uniref:Uncharacterized protein n=1 Tax=Delitschia confertaspora ATCC 74209 TaxID=1513339 RepID=A0A9P4MTH9_9PLEO|nr:hypothetical protein GQ43DRAFT_439601 [Delitschia confertaspora ATCC 74209]